MKVLCLSDESLKEAAGILLYGGTVVYPTETAYGLAADPFNPDAVQKIFLLKGRNEGKPLGLIAASTEQVEALCILNPEERALFRYWPGALSIVLALRTDLSPERSKGLSQTTGRLGTMSIRVSSHPSARNLAELLGHPIIATSANRSGGGEIYDLQTFNRMFDRSPTPDLFIDAGTLPTVKPSTVALVEDGKVRVLRQGSVIITNS